MGLIVRSLVFCRTHPLGPPLFAKARGRREDVDCFMELYPTVVPPAVFLHSLFAKEGAGGSSESGVVAEELTVFAAVFDFFHFLNDAVCMHPVKSLVYNIGLDRSGTNCGAGADNRELFQKKDSFNLMGDIHEDERIVREFMAAKRLSWKSRIKMLLRKTGWNFL